MPTSTLDPQEERDKLDDLERMYDAPSAERKKPVSADDLENQFNMPSTEDPADKPENQVYDSDGNQDSAAPAGKSSTESEDGPPEPEDLAEAEAAGGDSAAEAGGYENQVGAGYVKKTKNPGTVRKYLGESQNRIFLIGGGGAVLIAIIAILLFVALAPLKILNIVNNLQNRFYATSENAVQHETDVLFSDYMRRTLRRCPGEITKDCNPFSGGGLVTQLYKGWRAAKLEDKIAKNYKIEFKYTKGHYYVKMPGMSGDGANIDDFENTPGMTLSDEIDKSGDPQWKKVGRAELRQSYRDALAGETKWKQLLYRYKIGGLLSRKYGLKRCIIACDAQDNFDDWKDNKTKAAKLILVERVLKPRSETLALVVGCVIAGNCDKTQTADDGKETTKVEQRLQSQLDELALEETGKYADVLAHSNGILKDGYQKYIIKQVVSKLIGKEVSDTSADKLANAIPVVGWINEASNVVDALDKAPQEVKMASYLTNATAMIGLYTTYRVYADEIKTGHADSQIVGSFNNTLGPGQKNDMGGAAAAEGSPLYQKLIDGKSSPSTADYKCNDGKPVPSGQLVCPEEVLGGSKLSGTLKAITDNSEFQNIAKLAYYWDHSIGWPLKKAVNAGAHILSSALKHIWGFSALEDYLGKMIQPLINAFVNYMIPSPFGDIRDAAPSDSDSSSSTALVNALVNPAYADNSSNSGYMSGARVFDLMAGGADASGNDYAHNGLGGQALTPEQSASIINEQLNQDVQSYQNQPVLARLFDTNSPYSLVSKIALAMPATKGQMFQTVGSFFSDPFSKLFHAFGLMLSPARAFAAAGPDADPFGITQYGYSANDPALTAANQDPAAYWNQQCSSDGTTIDWKKPVNAQWQEAGLKAAQSKDSSDGMPENTTTDPCLLLQAAVGSAGGLYDDSLLGDDQPGTDGSASNSGGSGSLPSGDAQQLAQQILSNSNVGYEYDAREDIQAAANGQPGTAGAPLSATLLRLIDELAQSHKFNISALESHGQGHSGPGDPHYEGDAVDIVNVDGDPTANSGIGRTTADVNVINELSPLMPKSSGNDFPHLSGFGQKQCGSTPALPSGITTFDDTCSHLHIQVPVGSP